MTTPAAAAFAGPDAPDIAPRITAITPNPADRIISGEGLDSVGIQLDQDVVIPTGAVSVFGVNAGVIEGYSVEFDQDTNLLTVTLNEPVFLDIITIVLDYSITGTNGLELDGELGQDEMFVLPSGNGVRGGKAVFRYEILQGDIDDSGQVDLADLNAVLANFGTATSAGDASGDGQVNLVDLNIVLSAFELFQPNFDAPPIAPVSISPAPGQSLDGDLSAVTVTYDGSVDGDRLEPADFYVIDEQGVLRTADSVSLTASDTVRFTFSPAIAQCGQYSLNLSNAIGGPAGSVTLRPSSLPVVSGLNPPSVPTIQPISTPTAMQIVTVTGSVQGASTVRVVGPELVYTGIVSNGQYSVDVELPTDMVHTIYVSGVSACGVNGPSASIEVIRDTSAPFVFIDFPLDGQEVTTSTITVTGRVNDEFSGLDGVSVTVNGQSASVGPGPGGQGTFVAMDVPLAIGSQSVTVIATDLLGNQRSETIAVTRIEIPAGTPTIEMVNGDGQSAAVSTPLASPLVVRARGADGSPLAGKVVTFTIDRNDGVLSRIQSFDGETGQQIQVVTNNFGIAFAYWKLGRTAGPASNRVRVTSRDLVGTVFFCADGIAADASRILVGDHNNQRGETGAPLPKPLTAYVTDGDAGNPIAGVPVIFTVVRGDGMFANGEIEITVATGSDGRARAPFTLGSLSGNNRVEATFFNNPGLPAVFNATGIARVPGQPTTLSGVVLDNGGRAIGGALATLTLPLDFAKGPQQVILGPVETGVDGRFTFDASLLPAGVLNSELPGGPAKVLVSGVFATSIGGEPIDREWAFPYVGYNIVLVEGASNTLQDPVWLPELDPDNEVEYDGSQDVVLTVAGVEGLEFRVKAGSMTLEDGTVPTPSNPETIRLNQVHFDEVPMDLPNGNAVPFAWTLQPKNARFDPPVEITLPNMTGEAPGTIVQLLQWNNDTADFQTIGTGRVSADGSVVESESGSGIRVAGWGGAGPPPPPGGGGGTGDDGEGGVNDNCPRGLACVEDDQEEPDAPPNCKRERTQWALEQAKCTIAGVNAGLGLIPVAGWPVGCGVGVASGMAFAVADCTNSGSIAECANDIFSNLVFGSTGCFIPYAGNTLSAVQCAQGLNTYLESYVSCQMSRGLVDPNEIQQIVADQSALLKCAEDVWRSILNNDVWFEVEPQEAWKGLIIWQEIGVVIRQDSDGGVEITEEERVSLLTLARPHPVTESDVIELCDRVQKAINLEFTSEDIDLDVLGSSATELAIELERLEGDGWQTTFELYRTAYPLISKMIGEDVERFPGNHFVLVVNTNDSAETALRRARLDESGVIQSLSMVPGDLYFIQYFDAENWATAVTYINGPQAGEVATLPRPWFVDIPEDAVDSDADGLPDIAEVIVGTSNSSDDTDNDDRTDLEEILIGSNPLSPIDERWTVSAGGVNGVVDIDGSLSVQSIPAGNDLVRLEAVGDLPSRTLYAYSEFFEVIPDQFVDLGTGLVIETERRPTPISLSVDIDSTVLLVGQSGSLITTGQMSNGTQADLTPRSEGTTYRTTNPAIATVNQNGFVTAVSGGTVFFTASNQGATSTVRIEVAQVVINTTLVGVAQFEDGTAASNAEITVLPFGNTGLANASGQFSFEIQVPTDATMISVRVVSDGFVGVADGVELAPGSSTDAGVITLRPIASGPLFPGPMYNADNGPISVAIDDLDGDGYFDLAVANEQSDNVSVLINNGDGTFASNVLYSVDDSNSVAIGDLDGDGDADLAVANLNSDNVSVLLNNGDGTFASDVLYGAGDGPVSVAIGDLDGDGDADLAVANENGDNVSVLINNGDATFQPSLEFAAGARPSSVAIGDLNGDGNADLAVANRDSGNVSVLMNRGNGSFATGVLYDAGIGPLFVAMGDLDADGDADLAVANLFSNAISVLLNNGDGIFASHVLYEAGIGPISVAIGDLNGDGDADLAVSNLLGNDITVLVNNGDGSFVFDALYTVGGGPWSVAIEDLNADGDADLAVANLNSDTVSVLLNNGDGTFPFDMLYEAGNGPISVAIADLDDDGAADLAAANEQSGNISVLLNNGDGTFGSDVLYDAGNGPISIAIGYVDDDGNADLVVANRFSSNISVLINNGDGTFASDLLYGTGNSPVSVAIGDLDDDGDADLVAANLNSNNVSVLLNNGDGTFGSDVLYGAGNNPFSVAIGDLDGDGDADLAVANLNSDNVSVLLNNGDGSFASDVLYGAGDGPVSVAIGDLDGDGDADLAVVNELSANVSVLINNGDGSFASDVRFGVAVQPLSVAIGDLDGDGDADLAVANLGSYKISVLLNNGDATFQPRQDFDTGDAPYSVAIGDIDGEGLLDLATACNGSNSVSVLLNQRTQGRTAFALFEGEPHLPIGGRGMIDHRLRAEQPADQILSTVASAPTASDPALDTDPFDPEQPSAPDGDQPGSDDPSPNFTSDPTGYTIDGHPRRIIAQAIEVMSLDAQAEDAIDKLLAGFPQPDPLVNAAGLRAETRIDGKLGVPRAVVVQPDGKVVWLAAPSGATSTRPIAINDRGTVIAVADTPGGESRCFLYCTERDLLLPISRPAASVDQQQWLAEELVLATVTQEDQPSRLMLWSEPDGLLDLTLVAEQLEPNLGLVLTGIHCVIADDELITEAIDPVTGETSLVRLVLKIFERLPGDVDASGEIDQADLGLLIDWISAEDPRGDLNEDGAVTADDLAVVVQHFGKRGRHIFGPQHEEAVQP